MHQNLVTFPMIAAQHSSLKALMSRYLALCILLLLIRNSLNCIPTQTTTTTTTPACCAMLTQSALPRRAPSLATFQQCSVLRRISSSCPTDGYIFCDAAPDTNPTTMQIEFYNASGVVVRTVQQAGTTMVARIFCQNGTWVVRSAATANTNVSIATVSCAQTGSTGADRGFVTGSAQD